MGCVAEVECVQYGTDEKKREVIPLPGAAMDANATYTRYRCSVWGYKERYE